MNEEKAKKTAKLQLNLMLLITILPIVAAYVAYYTGWGVPADTVNNGVLLRPAIDVKDWLPQAEGEQPSYTQNKTWRLFLPVTDNCAEACEQLLYLTRQVHVRLAQRADRVERVFVNIGGGEGKAIFDGIAESHPKLKVLSLDRAAWDDWVAGTNLPNINEQPYYLLIDQVGFAMMYYTTAQDGNQLLKDVKRVLKFSPEE